MNEKSSLPPEVLANPQLQRGWFAGETAKHIIVAILQSWGITEARGARKIISLAASIGAYITQPTRVSRPSTIILRPADIGFGLREEGAEFWLEIQLPPDSQLQVTKAVEQAIGAVVAPLTIRRTGSVVLFKLT